MYDAIFDGDPDTSSMHSRPKKRTNQDEMEAMVNSYLHSMNPIDNKIAIFIYLLLFKNNKSRNLIETVSSNGESEEMSEYVYDIYRLASESTPTDRTQLPSTAGVIVYGDIEEILVDDVTSDDEEYRQGEDEDSNSENWRGNDYPDEEGDFESQGFGESWDSEDGVVHSLEQSDDEQW